MTTDVFSVDLSYSGEELAVIMDEVINDGNLGFGNTTTGRWQRADSAQRSCSVSIADQSSVADPSIFLSHASFSWTVENNVREEAGPSISGSTSVFGELAGVSMQIHDVMYKPIGWTAGFSRLHALQDINLSIPSGCLTVLVGIVGSGTAFANPDGACSIQVCLDRKCKQDVMSLEGL